MSEKDKIKAKPKSGRGRPVGPVPAKTLAERSAAMRERAAALCDDPDAALDQVKDSPLLWAFEKAYREKRADCAARVAAELLRRLGVAATPAEPSKAVEPAGSQVKGYPPEVKARALAMKAGGATLPDIAAMIGQECGHAPGRANLAKHLARWAAKSDV